MQPVLPQKLPSLPHVCGIPAFDEWITIIMYRFGESGLTYVDSILEMGIFLCSFDFSGCGNSEG